MRKNIAFSAFLLSIILFLSCQSNKQQSSKTGWNYNDPKWGGYQVYAGFAQTTPSSMVFIEGGSFLMGSTQEDMNYEYNNIPKRVTVSSFYMDETEVRNVDYNEYLFWLERIYGQDYPEVVKQAWPDENCWRTVGSYVEHLVENYLRHPSYNDYPVVGISWEQADGYCKWRTDRLNEYILIQQGFLQMDPAQSADNHFTTEAYLAGQYVGLQKKSLVDLNPNASEKKRPVRFEDGMLVTGFRLPTEAEWEYAANGLIGNSYDERVIARRVYPWNGNSVRMEDKQHLGQMRANFSRGKGDYMGTAGALNDAGDYTVNVYSYAPNDFGLFNMAGNVAEWVMDVYRPLTFEDADELNAFRGNVYTEFVRSEEGNNIPHRYAGLAERDSLGRIPVREVSTEELAGRRNYQKADNRNYNDGDFASTVSANWDNVPADTSTTDLVYDTKTSLISDRSRVVKGGSFKDRAYHLSPSNRRYLDQGQSEAWIGFRCAMSRVGKQTLK
ncbi:MAG: SUMF1/EgtB/PvdO family nonheme iron enzyme [Bacteroidales bacterium]|jgi:gliding motility-associated lipoprotein GldJ|nr:SUMF1/EgtB/PvdO family nonheme iron enzyme [Bacteroidales bacterium]